MHTSENIYNEKKTELKLLSIEIIINFIPYFINLTFEKVMCLKNIILQKIFNSPLKFTLQQTHKWTGET